MPNVYTIHVCCLKTTTVKDGFGAKMSNGAHIVCATCRKRTFVCGRFTKWQAIVYCGS